MVMKNKIKIKIYCGEVKHRVLDVDDSDDDGDDMECSTLYKTQG